ncbi:hypothetical protein KPH14_002063 [Odynerus spinipes]|uniref:Major facilitator superfamily (MFS) profile domain-containing protein n=1 Tax=Odynerus spinipes TaxID=1348599 RepID=A0AAD9VL55_9HYME|nr:hypothetical protein KPH14_002063 [Odynerus spinipes]
MSTDTEKGKYVSPDGSKTWEYLATFVCSLLFLCVGTISGWNSPTTVLLLAPDSPIPVTSSEISTLAAIVTMGYMLGSPLCMVIVDKIGRKNTLLFSVVPMMVSWGLVMIAESVIVLWIARLIAGFSLGLCLCVTPMYLGEISSVDTRGAGGALLGIMYNLGVLLAFTVVPYLSIPVMAGIFLLLSLCFFIIFCFMPDSPYYLAMKGRMEEAEEVLEKLRGKTDVSEESRVILESLKKEEKNKTERRATLKDIFMIAGNRRAFFILLCFVMNHKFGGFIVIVVYGQLIFQETATAISDHTANIAIGVAQVISCILTIFLVDRVGRRPLIFLSGFMVGLCNLAVGSFFYAKDYLDMDVSSFSLVPFAACTLMVFFFNCGFTGLQLVVMSEIFAIEVKALSTCVIGIVAGMLGTLSCKLYIFIALTCGYGHSFPFIGSFIVVWVSTAVILRLLPETKGKTFAEIQRELQD